MSAPAPVSGSAPGSAPGPGPAEHSAASGGPPAAFAWTPWVFVVIWSTGFIVARYAMPHAPPLKFLVLRYAFSLLGFAAWALLSRARWPAPRRQWGHLAVVGLLLQAGYLGGVWAAVKAGIGAGTVALLVGLQPVLTAVWLSLTARGPGGVAGPGGAGAGAVAGVSPRQWLGLALGFAGLALVVWRKLGAGEVTALNLGLSVAALLSITAGTLYQKRHVQAHDMRTAGVVQMLAALAVTLPLAALEREPVVWHPQLIGALAWSVLALTIGAGSLLYRLIQRGAATEVASLMYLVPPCTAIFAWLLFGEPLTPTMGIGMALTALGVACVVRAPRRA